MIQAKTSVIFTASTMQKLKYNTWLFLLSQTAQTKSFWWDFFLTQIFASFLVKLQERLTEIYMALNIVKNIIPNQIPKLHVI